MAGTATISIEIELGWGLIRYGKFHKLSEDRRAETRYLSRLLDLCDEYDVPITFDVVGHLFYEECDGSHGGPHDDDWWDIDPGTSVAADPEFYAPDLIADIRSRETDHEICTHTFSHIECDEVDPEVVRWELERANRVHTDHGVGPSDSIVPPRHSAPPSTVLEEAGIRVKRVPFSRAEGEGPPATSGGKLFEILFGTHPTIEPRLEAGILETYSPGYTTFAAPYLQTGTAPPHSVYRAIPLAVRRRLHEWNLRRGVDAAVASDSSVHYWCHLYDFSNAQQWPQIDSFVRYLARRREDGAIGVRPMRELQAGEAGRGDRVRADLPTNRTRPDPVSDRDRENSSEAPLTGSPEWEHP